MQPHLPDKPVSWIASLFRGLLKEYSCDYRVFTRKIYKIRSKLKNLKKKKQSIATQHLNFKVFKFTMYYVNFPSIYTIVTWIFFH